MRVLGRDLVGKEEIEGVREGWGHGERSERGERSTHGVLSCWGGSSVFP